MMQNETTNNLSVKTAKAVSFIFNPLFMPIYGLLIVLFAPTLFWYLPLKVKEILFFIFLINNLLIPVSLIPFFRYRHIISSMFIEKRRERMIPLITVSFLYLVTSFILFRLQIPLFLKAYSYALTLLAIALLVINLRWKISLHSAGAGALTALVLVLSLKLSSGLPLLIIFSVLLSGIILASRLRLNTNSPSEVYAGFTTGFVILAVCILLFQ